MTRTRWRFSLFPESWLGQTLVAVLLSSSILVGVHIVRRGGGAGPLAAGPTLTADDLWRLIEKRGLRQELFMLPISEYGLQRWQVGDFATYSLVRDQGPADPEAMGPEALHTTVQVIGAVDSTHALSREVGMAGEDQFWIRLTNFDHFRGMGGDLYRMVLADDLRVSTQTPSLTLNQGYFPLHNTLFERQREEMSLPHVDLIGSATITTPAGTFECDHLRFAIHEGEPIDVWVTASIPPLGIVRLTTSDETLLLERSGRAAVEPLDPMIAPLIDGRSTLAHGCASCHPGDDYHQHQYPPR